MSDTPTGGPVDTGAIEADLSILRDDVARLTDTLSALVADSAATAKTVAREGVDRATAVAESAKERAYEAADDLSAQIEQNPLTSVLIALGVGYVVGVLGRSRR